MGAPDVRRHTHTAGGRTERRSTSINEPVILCVRTNPEPHDAVTLFDSESAVAATDANRPETVDLLEVQRWMLRIVTKPLVALVREALDWRRQLPIATPESGGRAMSHRSRVRPCRRSSRASSASAFSRPADASCSNCVSHSAASNSMNHTRNAASSSAESWATAASISLLPDTHQDYDYRLLAARKPRQTI